MRLSLEQSSGVKCIVVVVVSRNTREFLQTAGGCRLVQWAMPRSRYHQCQPCALVRLAGILYDGVSPFPGSRYDILCLLRNENSSPIIRLVHVSLLP